MSDWNKQTAELAQTWAETQKKLWDTWMDAVEAAKPQALEAERRKLVDAWESSLSKGLAAQAEWAKLWADGLSANRATPKPMLEWAKQLQEMMKGWSASQEQLAHLWFEMVRKLDSAELSEAWERQGQELVKAWREAADKAIEAQREMSKAFQKRA